MNEEVEFPPTNISDEPIILDFTEKAANALGFERYEGRACDFYSAVMAMKEVFASLKEQD